VIDKIARLRRQHWAGKQFARASGVSPATVSRVLRRLGLNRLNALEPGSGAALGKIGAIGHRITGWRRASSTVPS
jgi:hypothetical protein